MKQHRIQACPARQRGATLIVGLIVLMLITAMVAAAYKFSTFNLKAVNNMQTRAEAVAAASSAIETMVGSWAFNTAPGAGETHSINIDNDNLNVPEYTVVIAAPTCLRAIPVTAPPDAGSDSQSLDNGMFVATGVAAAKVYQVLWDVDAVATDTRSGTRVRVHQGVSRTLTQAQCNTACGPAAGVACQ